MLFLMKITATVYVHQSHICRTVWPGKACIPQRKTQTQMSWCQPLHMQD